MRLFPSILLLAVALSPASSFAQALPNMNNCTIASLSGSSQSLVSANPQRKYLLIMNTGNASIGLNLSGGTAVLAGAGTITLVAGASVEYPKTVGNIIPANAITVIGTAGQPVACDEGR